jgi:type II secretory pathway component PulM
LALIGSSAGKAGISGALSKLDPEGTNLARVTLSQAPFSDVMRWLIALRNEYGVKVVNASIRKGAMTGTVDVQITLEVPAT